MSKRGGDSTPSTKVKKRRGVGSRTITVPDSDEEDPPLMANSEYVRVTKTRVGTSGKAERVSTTSVPILEAEQSNIPTPLEDDVENPVDVIEDVVPAVPAKRQRMVNDSVSNPT
jgi:hypothetical protein